VKKCSKFKRKLLLIAICFDVVLSLIYFSTVKLVLKAGGEIFKSNISNCSYYAIEKCISDKVQINDLYKIQKDNNGKIVFIETDALLLNYIVKNLALDCYDYMNEYVSGGFEIPLGAFSGVKLLAGYGPKVNVKLTTALSVECKIVRTFTSAGINQTRQTLSAVIFTEITVFAPFYREYYDGNIEIVLFDNLIVGEVPSTYLDVQVLASGKVSE